MIVKQYIKNFEKLGFGMFVHFGIYSMLGKGEWAKNYLKIPDHDYDLLRQKFIPKKEWTDELVTTAKNAGCKYITLTMRHHDGFSLYDTCGLNKYDAPHGCGRDLAQEFVVACRKQDIVPFFYHTLLDWHETSYQTDFPEYLKYLRASVELLCRNYGKIGGLWFDGMWDKPDADWEEGALYATIRKYQPEAMIINNTGLAERGKLGNIELDSVTFERGKPQPINLEDSPKYIASEMCQVFGDHWGYAEDDLNYKSTATIIEDLAACRRYGSNLLLNVGPTGNGTLRLLDRAMLETVGKWVAYNDEAIRAPRPTEIEIENKPKDFMLKNEETYYLFVHDLPMIADPNVALNREADYVEKFRFDQKIRDVRWLDNGQLVAFSQNGDQTVINTEPFRYGENLVVRVAKIKCWM